MSPEQIQIAIERLATGDLARELVHFREMIPAIASRDLAIKMGFVGGAAAALGMLAYGVDIENLARQLALMNQEIYDTGTREQMERN